VTDTSDWPDLASRQLGGNVVYANDEAFASAHNLLTAGPAAHDAAAFDLRGKVYDGWETRRRRDVPHGSGSDYAIVRLGVPGIVRAVTVDTTHFTGNYPPAASVHATTQLGYPSAAELETAGWAALLDHAALAGDTTNEFTVEAPERVATHVRLTIHPDGGVSRLRVHGEPIADPRFLGGRVDLAATVNGGRILDCSNRFYSSPSNVLVPGRARVMSDGWETARRRTDDNDWLVVRLGAPGVLHDVVIDTGRFVGNAPGWARVSDADTGAELLARTALQPDTEHRFRISAGAPVSSVRLDVYPDGGISRLRINGTVTEDAREEMAARWLGLIGPELAASVDPGELFS
jgi:allantoicase